MKLNRNCFLHLLNSSMINIHNLMMYHTLKVKLVVISPRRITSFSICRLIVVISHHIFCSGWVSLLLFCCFYSCYHLLSYSSSACLHTVVLYVHNFCLFPQLTVENSHPIAPSLDKHVGSAAVLLASVQTEWVHSLYRHEEICMITEVKTSHGL